MFAIPEDDNVLEFRDGPRLVPEYLVVMMSGIETAMYTYEQAVALANQNALGDQLGRVRERMVREHFTEVRDGHR